MQKARRKELTNPRIVLATVSGKVYYKLSQELRRQDLPFLSLKPWDNIPFNAKAVITTELECHLVRHPKLLTVNHLSSPARIICEAVRILREKQSYSTMIIGMDPGKTYGIAVIADGNLLRVKNCSSVETTLDYILASLNEISAAGRSPRIM